MRAFATDSHIQQFTWGIFVFIVCLLNFSWCVISVFCVIPKKDASTYTQHTHTQHTHIQWPPFVHHSSSSHPYRCLCWLHCGWWQHPDCSLLPPCLLGRLPAAPPAQPVCVLVSMLSMHTTIEEHVHTMLETNKQDTKRHMKLHANTINTHAIRVLPRSPAPGSSAAAARSFP